MLNAISFSECVFSSATVERLRLAVDEALRTGSSCFRVEYFGLNSKHDRDGWLHIKFVSTKPSARRGKPSSSSGRKKRSTGRSHS